MVGLRYLFTCALFVLACLSLRALPDQEQKGQTMRLDEKQWREITEDADYSEHYEVSEHKSEEPTGKAFSGSYKYLIYTIIAAAIILAIWRITRSLKNNPNVETETKATVMTLDEAEQDLPSADLDHLLKEALDQKDYRLALRIRFLIVIKDLSEKGKINWAQEKTNWEYYREIREKLLADKFRYVVLEFERYWYGERPLDEPRYNKLVPDYLELQNSINN